MGFCVCPRLTPLRRSLPPKNSPIHQKAMSLFQLTRYQSSNHLHSVIRCHSKQGEKYGASRTYSYKQRRPVVFQFCFVLLVCYGACNYTTKLVCHTTSDVALITYIMSLGSHKIVCYFCASLDQHCEYQEFKVQVGLRQRTMLNL